MTRPSLGHDAWRRIDDLFASTLDLPAEKRGGYLDRHCGDDPEARQLVERLLEADRAASRFLRTSPLKRGSDVASTPERLGSFRLLREIGRGGMGTVFLAARDDDQFHQWVAIKLMNSDARDADTLARFRNERQILADLEHPLIARLYDGGTTDDGRPFLVMEYVDGVPIDEYCNTHTLSVAERLDLVLQVCSAVDHAHRNLLVHRDLKPSNILVTDAERPVLLDFGIAKLLAPNPGDEDGAPATRAGVRLMTPEYASPEQIRGEPITTASDVYSLAVVLFELLTGRTPYPTRSNRFGKLEDEVCEREPLTPSDAARRGPPATGPPEALRGLDDDLDAILLKALRKEPDERYSSVEALAEDIRRYRDGRPVLARRGSRRYRAMKFLRRHRLAVAAAAAALAAGLAFTVALVVQSEQLKRLREVAENNQVAAEQESDKARAALNLLLDLFKGGDGSEGLGIDITAREVLEIGARRIDEGLDDQPEVQSLLQDSIGTIFLHLGLFDRAAPLLESALNTRRQLYSLDEPHPELATSLSNLGEHRHFLGQFEPAEKLYREALHIRRQALPSGDPATARTLNLLGGVRRELGDLDQAEALHREALAAFRSLEPSPHPEIATTLLYLGSLHTKRRHLDAAEEAYREALDVRRQVFGEEHPGTAQTLSNLGAVLNRKGDYRGAATLLRQAVAISRQHMEASNPILLSKQNNLGFSFLQGGDLEAADAVLSEALSIWREHYPKAHPKMGFVLTNLGVVRRYRGLAEDAISLHREALDIRLRIYGDDHSLVGRSRCELGNSLRWNGRLDAAETEFQACQTILGRTLGEDHVYYSHALVGLGETHLDRGDILSALPLLERGLEIRRADPYPNDRWIAAAERALGAALTAQASTGSK